MMDSYTVSLWIRVRGVVLYQFDHNSNYDKGYRPSGGLIHGRDGNFYGVTVRGGAYGFGVAYR